MNLVNVGLESLGAKIKTFSSCLDSLQQPSNILDPTEDSLWATGEGLPQYVIVSLEELKVKYRNIIEVGFMLWHDYETNPKNIQLWVAQTTDQQFTFWAEFQLDQKKGLQIYEIKPLPQSSMYLKISVTQTYGAFQTYLNQIFFMAEGVTQRKIQPKNEKKMIKKQNIVKQRQLNLQDLQQNLDHLIEVERRISRSKSKSKKKQKVLNQKIREKQSTKKQQSNKIISKKRINQKQISKGSISSNRAGLSIYYRQEQASQSHQYVSNQYVSSSPNNQKQIKRGQKLSSQQSQQYSQSLQSNPLSSNTNLMPSLNYTMQHDQSLKRLMNDEQKRHGKSSNKKQGNIKSSKRFMKQRQHVGSDEQHDSQEYQRQEQQNIEEQSQNDSGSLQHEQNTPKYRQHKQRDSPSQDQLQREDNLQHSSQQDYDDYNQNVHIMALAQHVIKIQENMENIQRKVEVLDLKVSHSHQKIQQQIFNKVQDKVQQIVERKLQKIWSSKNVIKNLQENIIQRSNKKSQKHLNQQKQDQNQFNYKKNLTKQFFKNDYYDSKDQQLIQRDKTKTKRRANQQNSKGENRKNDKYGQKIQFPEEQIQKMNRLKTSKSFAHIGQKRHLKQQTQMTKNDKFPKNRENDREQTKKSPNQQYIGKLLEKLNIKLKQREVKLYKIHKKQRQRQHNSHKKRQRSKYYKQNNFFQNRVYKNQQRIKQNNIPTDYHYRRTTTADDGYGDPRSDYYGKY